MPKSLFSPSWPELPPVPSSVTSEKVLRLNRRRAVRLPLTDAQRVQMGNTAVLQAQLAPKAETSLRVVLATTATSQASEAEAAVEAVDVLLQVTQEAKSQRVILFFLRDSNFFKIRN